MIRPMDHPLDLLHLGPGGEVALAVYVFPLVLAAISDFRTLRIPNYLTVALAVVFPLAALASGQHVDWLSHLEAGFAVFAGGAVLFALGYMGGGDVKLLAATALWAGLGQVVPLLATVAIVGGGFALIMLMLRHHFVQTVLLASLHRIPNFAQKQMPIPYGIPIAIAGLLMAPMLPVFG
jgi:prepilin peptidase CpaA